MGPLNRNAAFRRRGTTGPCPSSCRLKAAFRGGFMGREQRRPDRKSCAQLCEALQMLQPLPEGEGRGEGKLGQQPRKVCGN